MPIGGPHPSLVAQGQPIVGQPVSDVSTGVQVMSITPSGLGIVEQVVPVGQPVTVGQTVAAPHAPVVVPPGSPAPVTEPSNPLAMLSLAATIIGVLK